MVASPQKSELQMGNAELACVQKEPEVLLCCRAFLQRALDCVLPTGADVPRVQVSKDAPL